MDRKQVEAIFETLKEEFLSSKVAVKNPVAYIFGGQPAVGKSNLEKKIDLSICNILSINGDNYRVYHPDFISLTEQNLHPSDDFLLSLLPGQQKSDPRTMNFHCPLTAHAPCLSHRPPYESAASTAPPLHAAYAS